MDLFNFKVGDIVQTKVFLDMEYDWFFDDEMRNFNGITGEVTKITKINSVLFYTVHNLEWPYKALKFINRKHVCKYCGIEKIESDDNFHKKQ